MTKYLKTVYVKLTNRCNLTCEHCYNSVCTDQGQMSSNTLNKILHYIADLKEQGYDVDVALHGGEPMIYRDMDALWEFVRACNEMKTPITMTTNLVYNLTNDILDLFECFDQCDGDKLLLTSWDYKIRFEQVGKRDNLKTWEKNVRKVLERGIKVQPIVSLTKILLEEKTPEDIFSYMYELGVRNLNFERLTCNGRAKDNSEKLMPTNAQVDDWLCEAYKLWKEKYTDVYVPILDALEWAAEGTYIGCRERRCVQNVRTFNPDGSMATCPNIPLDTVGNIEKMKTVYEIDGVIEGNKKFNDLRRREEIKHDECYTCEYYNICNGDCFQLGWDDTGCPGLKKTIVEVYKNYGKEN